MIWKMTKARNYSVRLMYELLSCHTPTLFPVQPIWNPLIPLKVGFFFFFFWLGTLLGVRS